MLEWRSIKIKGRSLFIPLKLLNDRADSADSRRSIFESLAFSAVWIFAVCLNNWRNGFFSKIPIVGISADSSAAEIRKAWGPGDAGSLLEIAISWSELRSLDETTQFWIPRLWSPGMAIIEVPLIWLENAGLPLFWALFSLTAITWGSIVFLVWRYFSPGIGRIPTAFVLIALIHSWDFGYILKNYIFYTEGIGYGLLLIGLILVTIRVINPHCLSQKHVALAGAMVGISIWVRHTSDSGLTLALVLILLLSFIHKIKTMAALKTYKRKNSRRKVKIFEESIKSDLKLIWLRDLTIFSLVAFLVTIPWRLISTFHFKGIPFAMSSSSGGVPYAIWSTPESGSGSYWGVYGSNWACKIDRVTCAIVQSDIESGTATGSDLFTLAAQSVIRNPIKYLEERFSFLFTHWIPNFSLNLSYQNIVALIFLFLFAFNFLIFFRLKDQKKYPILIIWGSFLLMNFAQLSIIHYESRYFIPVRLLTLGAFIGLFLIRNEGQTKVNSTINPRRVSKNGGVG